MESEIKSVELEDTLTFDLWLRGLLKSLKTDEDVFGPYVTGILESDEDLEEKVDNLEGLFGSLGKHVNGKLICEQVLDRWNISLNTKAAAAAEFNGNSDLPKITSDLDELLKITSLEAEKNLAASSNSNKLDSGLRNAILSSYVETESDSDDDDPSVKKPNTKNVEDKLGSLLGEKNTNKERVLNEQKEMRETQRLDAAKKREKDREDRAKQKQQIQDKKEKAKKKTAKVERKAR